MRDWVFAEVGGLKLSRTTVLLYHTNQNGQNLQILQEPPPHGHQTLTAPILTHGLNGHIYANHMQGFKVLYCETGSKHNIVSFYPPCVNKYRLELDSPESRWTEGKVRSSLTNRTLRNDSELRAAGSEELWSYTTTSWSPCSSNYNTERERPELNYAVNFKQFNGYKCLFSSCHKEPGFIFSALVINLFPRPAVLQ